MGQMKPIVKVYKVPKPVPAPRIEAPKPVETPAKEPVLVPA